MYQIILQQFISMYKVAHRNHRFQKFRPHKMATQALSYRMLFLSLPINGLDSWLFFSKFPDSVGSGRLLLKKPSFQSAIMSKIRTISPTIIETIITHNGTSEGSLIFKSGYATVST